MTPFAVFLPDATLFGIHHGRAGLAVEGFLELRHVRDDSVGTVLFRRVRVYRGAEALGFVAGLAAPALSVAYEETLLGREAVDWVELLAFGVVLPSHVGEQQAPEVGDVFAER